MNIVFKNYDKYLITTPAQQKLDADVIFCLGAIRAARNSSSAIRVRIIDDLAVVLGVKALELEFLFSTNLDLNDHQVYDFPDSER